MDVYCKRKYTLEKLSRDIHMKREEMIQLGLTSGLNSRETIQVSQELDKLILQYQCYKEKQTPKWFSIIKYLFSKSGMKENQIIFGECLWLVL